MCQRVNGWAEPAADRRVQGGVLRLCLACFHPHCVFLFSEQHQRVSRNTPEAPSPRVPCFLGGFQRKLFLVKLCHAVVLEIAALCEMRQNSKRTVAQDKVLMEIHGLCA